MLHVNEEPQRDESTSAREAPASADAAIAPVLPAGRLWRAPSAAARLAPPPPADPMAAYLLARAVHDRTPVAGSNRALALQLQRAALSPAPRRQIQRIEADDARLEDPGFLICTVFCYLGVPPSTFKDIMRALIEAMSEEAKATAGPQWKQRFDGYQKSLWTLGKFQLLAKALRFIIAGEAPPFGLIKTQAAKGIRKALIERLALLGVKEAGVVAAEQIIRKVSLVLELAAVGVCASYCGGTALGKSIAEFTDATAKGLADGLAAVEGALQALGEGIASAVSDFVAGVYGQLDAANWKISPSVPQDTRNDLYAMGWFLFAKVRPGTPWTQKAPDQTDVDAFFQNSTKPISSLMSAENQATLLPPVAAALQQTLQSAGSDAQLSAAALAAMSPVGLVTFLRDNGLLDFKQDPVAYGRAAAAAAPTAEAVAQ